LEYNKRAEQNSVLLSKGAITMNEVKLSVAGMTCANCVQTVERALTEVPGVERALADLDNHTVTIEFKEEFVNSEQLEETIQKAGYKIEAKNMKM
jgi:copper chaperone CopZ